MPNFLQWVYSKKQERIRLHHLLKITALCAIRTLSSPCNWSFYTPFSSIRLWILEHRNLVTYLILSFWHGAQSWHRIQTHYILLLWRINKMHRHVRHLVNTCQIESLIDDLELFSFQGICSVSLITEFTIQQSLHYGGGKN